MRIEFAKLSDRATIPTKAHDTDLGFDLYACLTEPLVILAGETKLVPTNIAANFPHRWGGLLRDRSSVATKRNLHVLAGVIDPEYTGEIKVALHNLGDMQVIRHGERIAQMILVESVQVEAVEIDKQDLGVTNRGERGFGSSGV